ncbi:MAG: heterodisulfide reductase-related iron-sulfur binding cluster, partial [Rhodospirillales bacterium]|nr:heterodisulfide reductase-related iron-sulfur binding cluster [Rhodospirillales bacterium]
GRARAGRTAAALAREAADGGLDAVVATASGCGTMLKDYGHLLKDDSAHASNGARVAELARDVSEVLAELDLGARGQAPTCAPVAYHSACSLQHGQRIDRQPVKLLADAGFTVRTVPDGHFCCGSAGTYNILQPDLAGELGTRKAAAIESTGAALVAAGNIGCMVQIAGHTALPVVHTVELLDWATGGPRPSALMQATSI